MLRSTVLKQLILNSLATNCKKGCNTAAALAWFTSVCCGVIENCVAVCCLGVPFKKNYIIKVLPATVKRMLYRTLQQFTQLL